MTEEQQNAAKSAVTYHVTHETDDKPVSAIKTAE